MDKPDPYRMIVPDSAFKRDRKLTPKNINHPRNRMSAVIAKAIEGAPAMNKIDDMILEMLLEDQEGKGE